MDKWSNILHEITSFVNNLAKWSSQVQIAQILDNLYEMTKYIYSMCPVEGNGKKGAKLSNFALVSHISDT